jgi:glycosyltransferase involved in cell wall biosynthesis
LRTGGGTRVKILEAAAAGIPVVSTPLGIEGLGMIPGRHVLVAETADQFASQVSLVANDRALRDGLVRAAYELVRDEHSLDAVRDSLRVALHDLEALNA